VSCTITDAAGFSITLRRLLLKNWNESATCVASTYSTWLMNVTFGTPSSDTVYNDAGKMPWKQGVRVLSPGLVTTVALPRRDPVSVRTPR
jgi:hypothetical protein